MMESVFNGIPGVTVHLDDILVTGATKEYLSTLEVLCRMSEQGLRLQREVCVPGPPWCTWDTKLMLKAYIQWLRR